MTDPSAANDLRTRRPLPPAPAGSTAGRSSAPLLVGIDVGTTSIKAVLYEPDGRAVAKAVAPTPTHLPRPGRAHYLVSELWDRVVATLRDALNQVDDPARIASVAVASVGESLVLVDAAGEPTTDEVIAWFDTRTQPQAAWLDRVIGKDELFARSGLSLQPIFSLCKLLWLKQEAAAAWRRTVRFHLLADYVAFRLSGVPATDASLASRTLALDLPRLRWHEGTIREAGLDPALFAPLVAGGTPLGPVTPEAAAATGLPTTAVVGAGGHDHVCGALAVGVTEPGEILNSLGTAEAFFLPLAAPLTDPVVGRQGYTQGAHVVGGRSYAFGGLYTSGASVEWARDLLFPGADPGAGYRALIGAAESARPGSLGVCFLPHLRLANPPHDDPRSRGTFVGLSTDVGRAELARAVLEGIAFEGRKTLEALLAHAAVRARPDIVAIGGGSQNDLLMRLKATVTNRPHLVVAAEEASALGAALLGGLAAGVYPDVPTAVAAMRHERTIVAPDPELVPVYDAIFRGVYAGLYDAVAPVSHAISILIENDGMHGRDR